jgi:hypothetical protein
LKFTIDQDVSQCFCFLSTVSDETPSKRGRPKKTISLNDRYPVLAVNDTVTDEDDKSANEALHREFQHRRPRKDIFLPLMKRSFPMRRHFILHNASSVQGILRGYPALKEASAVSK